MSNIEKNFAIGLAAVLDDIGAIRQRVASKLDISPELVTLNTRLSARQIQELFPGLEAVEEMKVGEVLAKLNVD